MALKEKIIKCFNANAFTYQQTADVQPNIAKRLAHSLPPIPAQRILEIGCGTGFLSEYLIKQYPAAEIVLIDIAPSMVDITRERFKEYSHVQVAIMDGEALTLEGNFDLIVSSMTLHWFNHLDDSLQKIIKRLTPGGRFLFACLTKNSIEEWRSLFQQHNVKAPTPPFPCHRQLQQWFPEMRMMVETIKQHYRNTHAFLKTVKSIGAHATHAKHVMLSPGRLREMMRRLDATAKEGVHISYEVVYGDYTKC